MRGFILFVTLAIVIACIAVPIAMFGPLGFLPGVLIAALVFCPIVYFWWAPNNLFFTFVKEGTVKVVVRADEVRKALVQWRGHTIDGNTWTVQKGEESHLLGGFRFYGFWPLDDIYNYDFSWTGLTEKGDLVEHAKETLDYVLLKDDVYWTEIKTAEDIDLLPLDVELLITMRVINPYKALFNVQNWNEMVMNRLRPLFREFIALKPFKKLIQEKAKLGEGIYDKLIKEGLIRELEEDYGVQIKAEGLQIKEINPPPEYREKTLLAFLAEMEKEAIIIGAEAEARKIKEVYKAVESYGDLGMLMKVLEALTESDLAASMIVHNVPGLTDILKDVQIQR